MYWWDLAFLTQWDGITMFRHHLKRTIWVTHPWKPPGPSCWKLNVDASWYNNKGVGGLGWSVRDSNGSLIGAGCKQISRNWAIKCLEAEAILEGLKAYGSVDDFEGRRRKLPLLVESDSIEVIGALNHDTEDFTELNLILGGIECSDEFLKVIRVSKWRREENRLAHNLARAAVEDGSAGFFLVPLVFLSKKMMGFGGKMFSPFGLPRLWSRSLMYRTTVFNEVLLY